MLQTVFSLFFPAVCVGCHRELRTGALCEGCQQALKIQSAPRCPHCDLRIPLGEMPLPCRRVLAVSHIAIAYPYRHPIAKAQIDALKYEGLTELAAPLGEALAKAIHTQWRSEGPLTLIPVPLHSRRENKRGYNQSTLIAGATAEHLGATLDNNLLIRTMHTPQQVGLHANQRRDNVVGAFRALTVPDRKATYVIVDDVTTTGATLRACARALREAGAKNIRAATVAQG